MFVRTVTKFSAYRQFVVKHTKANKGASILDAAAAWRALPPAKVAEVKLAYFQDHPLYVSPAGLHRAVGAPGSFESMSAAEKQKYTDAAQKMAEKFVSKSFKAHTAEAILKKLGVTAEDVRVDPAYFKQVVANENTRFKIEHVALRSYLKDAKKVNREDAMHAWKKLSEDERENYLNKAAKEIGVSSIPAKMTKNKLKSAAMAKKSNAAAAAAAVASKAKASKAKVAAASLETDSDTLTSYSVARFASRGVPMPDAKDDLAAYRRVAHPEDMMDQTVPKKMQPRVQTAKGKINSRVGATEADDYELGDNFSQHHGKGDDGEANIGRSRSAYRGAAVLGTRAATSPIMLGARTEQSKRFSTRAL